MPQATDQEDDKGVQHHSSFRYTAAAERNIDIVAKPCGKRDVPATPELGDVAAKIRDVEVASQFDAEQLGTADSDVAIAGEVAINLYGEQRGSEQ